MYTESQLQNKISELRAMSSENEVVEFKEAKTKFDFDKLGKYVSALANEANLKGKETAWLVFGVKDRTHVVVGTNYKQFGDGLMKLKKGIADKTTGRHTFREIHTILVDGKRVIMFDIPPSPIGTPVSYGGHFYARDHESLVSLGEEKYDRIRSQIKKIDWSAGLIESATIDDLDEAAIQFARVQFLQKHPQRETEIRQWDDAKFLDKAKITIHGKITRTAIILLGKEESEHFINPSDCKIRWKLLDNAGDSLDYDIIHIPFLLGVNRLLKKIRILKYRYIADSSIFPDEVDTYDVFSIREAINNCIAHQDYRIGARINVIEKADRLQFTNRGKFIPLSVEDVVTKDTPEEAYRNPHLVSAMYNLNMVDTEGGGIRKMYNIQAKKFFPLPEYELEDDRVSVSIYGKVLDTEFANLLAGNHDLSLNDIILLDKIQKKQEHRLTKDNIKYLRKRGLVEGRKGNLYLSKNVSQKSGQKASYSNLSGLDKDHYKALILKAIKDHGSMSRADIDALILDKLPGSYRDEQRKNLIMNFIQELRREEKIVNIGSRTKSNWVLS